MKQILNVQGMTCEHCEKAVLRAVKRLDRAALVQIDRAVNKVEIDSNLSPDILKQAIVHEGYTVLD